MKAFLPALLSLLLGVCNNTADSATSVASTPASTPAPTPTPTLRAIASARAVPAKHIDLASCAAVTAQLSSRCPGFILDARAAMQQTCAEVGGTLQPASNPVFWQLDIDADGRSEYLVDPSEVFYCDGAPSLYACGSLGCPYLLYREHSGQWDMLGHFGAMDAPWIEVLAGAAPANLRGGCLGESPCDELTSYRWNGRNYEAAIIAVRGHQVEVAPGGLWQLTRDIEVLATPESGAQSVGAYAAGIDVVVIGNAADPKYRFVSPCNACASGFVPTDVLRRSYGE